MSASGAGVPPTITLLTDFGLDDVYVGVLRGVIAGIAPGARVIDLCHQVAPQAVSDAAFLLDSAAPYFPWGTIHVCVVDPGVGSERQIVCVRTSRATYLAPDNGVLSRVLERDPPSLMVAVENHAYALPEISQTFHGRDIFAPVAAHLANGLDLRQLGPEVQALRTLSVPEPTVDGDLVHGRVIYVDRFGNLVSNIPAATLERELVSVDVAQRQIPGPLLKCYVERPAGELLAIEGSAGLLELSVNAGSAAKVLGVGRGTPLTLRLAGTVCE